MMDNPWHMEYIYNRIEMAGAPAKCSPLSKPITIRHNQYPWIRVVPNAKISSIWILLVLLPIFLWIKGCVNFYKSTPVWKMHLPPIGVHLCWVVSNVVSPNKFSDILACPLYSDHSKWQTLTAGWGTCTLSLWGPLHSNSHTHTGWRRRRMALQQRIHALIFDEVVPEAV